VAGEDAHVQWEQQKARIARLKGALVESDTKLAERDAKLAERDAKPAERDAKLAERDAKLAERDAKLAELIELHAEGFDLDASRVIHVERLEMRQRLEDLLRYCARPAISGERLSLDASGQVILRLKTPWHDGSTHVVYEPLDFISKLAALIPRPHKNLVLYHGVLSTNAAWRARVVEYGRTAADPEKRACSEEQKPPTRHLSRHLRRQWAELMRRGFGMHVLACPKCGGRLRLLALIMDRSTLRKLLGHAKLPTDPPGTMAGTPGARRAVRRCSLKWPHSAGRWELRPE
jgi:Putative transposase